MEFKLQPLGTPLSVTHIANVHYFEFTKNYQTVGDSHNFLELIYVDTGSLMVTSDHFSGRLCAKELILHCAGEKHSLHCGEDGHTHVIIIGFSCDCAALEPFSRTPVTLLPEHRRMLGQVMQEGTDLFAPPYNIPNTLEMKKRPNHAFAADQMLKNRLEAFLITLVRDRSALLSPTPEEVSNENKLWQICRYMKEHYREQILLDNLCFLFGTNRTSLCNAFREEYGMSILSYIDTLRISDAKKQLAIPGTQVTDLAESLGFSSVHYFCRYFKKHTGMSPKQYQLHVLLE